MLIAQNVPRVAGDAFDAISCLTAVTLDGRVLWQSGRAKAGNGNGKLLVDERSLWPNGQFVIGLLVVNGKFLKAHPDLVKNWIRAHVELTDWINAHPADAKKLLNEQIQRETNKALPADVLNEAFSRLQVTYDPLHAALNTAAQQAYDDGFLGRKMPDLSGLYDLTLLNQVLAEKKRKAIQ